MVRGAERAQKGDGKQIDMEELLKQLIQYTESEYYPFHMPGHKRRMPRELEALESTAKLDITEIDGFDNLHQPEGILLEAQQRAARVFGADETFFLINGSTAGILTAVSAAVPLHGRMIVARNCHKSVYHAIALRQIDPVFLYPETVREYGIADAILPGQVEEAIRQYPDAAAVLITSPTYDGVVSDVKAIADIVHRAGLPLIVDGAHGAHFGFAEGWPENPVRLGADLVIESLHKTLPALTQTALLHRSGQRVKADAVRRYEAVFQTSSPSYVLMSSIDSCVRLLENQGKEIFEAFSRRLDAFHERLEALEVLRLIGPDLLKKGRMKDFDRGKLLITAANGNFTGNNLYKELLNRYYLQMEMACHNYVTAILTPWDGEEGLRRLTDALLDMDGSLKRSEQRLSAASGHEWEQRPYPKLERGMRLQEAEEMPKISLPLQEAEGKIAGTYVNLYPPGIPLVIPGEILSEEVIKLIDGYARQGLNVQGIERTGKDADRPEEIRIALAK